MSSILSTALVWPLHRLGFPIQAMIVMLGLSIILTELLARRVEVRAPENRNLLLSLGFLSIATTASTLEVTRTFCVPDQHFVQGHAIWHLFTAVMIYFVFRYYLHFDRRFESAERTRLQVHPM